MIPFSYALALVLDPNSDHLIPDKKLLFRLGHFGWRCWEPLEISLGKDRNPRAEASWQPGEKADAMALILFHGVEGSARSHYHRMSQPAGDF